MWTKLLSIIFGSLVDVALKLFEHFKKKPEEILREKDEKKHENVLRDLAHPDNADSKPYSVRNDDSKWGKGKKG